MQQIQTQPTQTEDILHQTQGQPRQSSDLILLVSTLAAQLHQTREELDEAHELLHLMREKLKQLEPVNVLLYETQIELERFASCSPTVSSRKRVVRI